MDVQMPRQNGVQATAAITARDLPCRVIILTTFDYEDYVFEAIKAGAVGYLLKDTPAAELGGDHSPGPRGRVVHLAKGGHEIADGVWTTRRRQARQSHW